MLKSLAAKREFETVKPITTLQMSPTLDARLHQLDKLDMFYSSVTSQNKK